MKVRTVILMYIAGMVMFPHIHRVATEMRNGVYAVGGEHFAFVLVPVLAWVFATTFKDYRKDRRERRRYEG